MHKKVLNLEACWLPFTSNKEFKEADSAKIITRAEGMYYYSIDEKKILDAHGGLWCCNAGHNRKEIIKAIQDQAARLDFVPSYQMTHPGTALLADKLVALLSNNLQYAFFSNSGSEAVETALKIALAYWEKKGKKNKKILIGRDRAFHGTGFGGMSVGNIAVTKNQFNKFLPDVLHLSTTHDLKRNAFTKGEPKHGLELANELLDMIDKHGADQIAAVILEPVSGTGGVLIPPVGYLKKIREICTEHDILLIFDEVITGFGRLGKPFACNYYNVEPDLMCLAKGLTSGTVPMGATMVNKDIYKTFVDGTKGIELYHGYTYSGHPLACAAARATIELYKREGLLNLDPQLLLYWEEALHSLKGQRYIIDIRNIGLLGAIEFEPIPGRIASRAMRVFTTLYKRHNCYVRVTGGDIIAMAPPLIINRQEIDKIISSIREVMTTID